LHQAVATQLTTAECGALDGSAVAANASRRRLINQERLEQRLEKLETVADDEAQGEVPEAVGCVFFETTPSTLVLQPPPKPCSVSRFFLQKRVLREHEPRISRRI
jgi:hypothetical protein